MRHGSLFSGIGGFDLASEWMGWENVFHCEWNPFGQKVLNYYWPNAITYHDITKTDFTIHRGSIDILTGGFPCQPYSSAGKRLGKEDERHLWPEMLRAIREIQPTYIVGENVRGLTNWNGGLVFDEVQSDLEAEGYEVTPFLLPAASIGAPHVRQRIWFIAYNDSYSNLLRCDKRIKHDEVITGEGRINAFSYIDKGIINGNSTNSKSWREGGLSIQSKKTRTPESNESSGSVCGFSQSNATDSNGFGLQGSKFNGSLKSKRSFQRKSGQISRSIFSKWEKFPTVPPICNGDDGISNRLDSITFSKWRQESIKAGGNAIVPQVVHQIFKAIQQYNELDKQLTI
jgi:DNA (cytosine-5)-methyltransferase 1